ncbi:EamA family transporter RarD [Alphaproteobacteria bacterium LSUCC0684]
MYQGFVIGVLASVFWGLTPVFFKAMSHFDPLETMLQRIFWSAVVMFIYIVLTGRYQRMKAALKSRRESLSAVIGGGCIFINWYIFIYAVNTGQIIEASLGYYIYPMMVVALGVFYLKESLSRLEWASVAAAATGLLVKTIGSGGVPLIGVTVAITFTIYTLLGKTRQTGPVVGLFVEVIYYMPIAAAILWVMAASGEAVFTSGKPADIGLALATGLVTVIPLILYIASGRQIGMAIAGLLFYLAPSLHLTLGVLIYDEPFGQLDLLAFGFLWLAVVLLAVPKIWRLRAA